MKYRNLIIGIFTLFLTNTSQSQYLNRSKEKDNKTFLTGSLRNDLVVQVNQIENFDSSNINRKRVKENQYSPLAVGLYSAVVPGAGQFYTKTYWQSAAFFGAEVLSWVVYAAYYSKGNRQTDAFQNYADEHWSVVRYADWIQINYSESIYINPDQSLKPWERVHWDELNLAEGKIGALTDAQGKTYTGFSHPLAPYGDQQYYEMVGKYSQFGGGWDDAATFKTNGFTKADVIANNGIGNVSPRTLEYEIMREQANHSYNIATTVSYIIVANHVLSALEAALNASKINHRIQLQGHIQSRIIYGTMVEFVPTLHVKYEL
jgi:hypothetical protein